MKALYHLLFVLAAIHILASCSATGCTDNQNSLPLAGFYSMSTGSSIVPDSLAIEGIGAPDDSLLLSPANHVSSLYLPFRSAHNTTSYCFQYRQSYLNNPRLYDTLTFHYDAIPFFASEECGALYHYQVTEFSYTKHLIDSVAMTDSLITNVDRETIQIFFRTAEPPTTDNPDDPDNPDNPDNPGDPTNPTDPDDPDSSTQPSTAQK